MIERARVEALYGVKSPDRRLSVRIDYDKLERACLDMAATLRPVIERVVKSFEAFGGTWAGIAARRRAQYNERIKKRRPRHQPRWINGRLRPLTQAERVKKERKRGRLQDRSGPAS